MDWIRNKLFLFGTIVVIVRLELDAYRAADYSTTSLKLMPSHLCSGFKNRLFLFGSIVEGSHRLDFYGVVSYSTISLKHEPSSLVHMS